MVTFERCRRLVGNDQVGLVEEGDGDGDALAHAARQLVRISLQPALGCGHADLHKRLARERQGRSAIDGAVGLDRLDHLGVDPQYRVEGHHRVLEDHGDAVASERAHALGARLCQVLALEAHDAGDDAARGIDKADDREARDGLAAARLSDQTQHLARGDLQAHPVHRLDDAALGEEVRSEVFDLQGPWREYAPLRVIGLGPCAGNLAEGARHRRSLGFRASRSWSPTRLMLTIAISSARPGKKLIQ